MQTYRIHPYFIDPVSIYIVTNIGFQLGRLYNLPKGQTILQALSDLRYFTPINPQSCHHKLYFVNTKDRKVEIHVKYTFSWCTFKVLYISAYTHIPPRACFQWLGVRRWFLQGTPIFLYKLQLASHAFPAIMAEKMRKNKIPNSIYDNDVPVINSISPKHHFKPQSTHITFLEVYSNIGFVAASIRLKFELKLRCKNTIFDFLVVMLL